MLEKLTKEQEALCDAVVEEYIQDLTKPTLPDGPTIVRWLDVVYGFYDLKRPERVEIVESPHAALRLASELTGEKQTSLDWCGVGEGGWVSFYDYFHRIGVLKDEEVKDLLAFRDFTRCSWDTLLLDECAIVVQRPSSLKVDDAGNLHCPTGPCIEWADGEKDYAWHGTWVPERVVTAPRSYSKEEYLAITNTEERRALSESAGWGWVIELIGGQSADKWVDPKTELHYELFKVSDGQQLLSKQSPLLKDGKSQPRYIEPVHEDLRTAQAARKWQATRLTAAQCEADPHLEYEHES